MCPLSTTPSLALVFALLGAVACGGGGDPVEEIRRRQAAGDVAGTVEPLRELLLERGDEAEIYFLYGRALTANGEPGLAQWSLRRALEDPAWLRPAGEQLAYAALATRNYPLAIETATRVLAEQPDDPTLLMIRAQAHAHSRMHDEEALADAHRIFELDPDNLDAWEPRILALLGLQRPEEAAEAIDELGRRIAERDGDSDLAAWHCATASIFAHENGEAERALESWNDCLERHPGHRKVVPQAIEFFDKRGETDRSQAILREAVERDPAWRQMRQLLALRLRLGGDPEGAAEVLRGALENENPNALASAWFDLAKHHQELGEHAAAAQALGKAVEGLRRAGTPPPQLLFEYADALLLQGEHEAALGVADEMKIEAQAEMIRGRVAQERGDPVRALEHFERGIAQWPDNPWSRYFAAVAAESIGNFDLAIEHYRYSIRINPGATDVRVRLARLHMAEGKHAGALTMLRTRAEGSPLDFRGELLTIELWAWLGRDPSLTTTLEGLAKVDSPMLASSLVAAARGLQGRAGAQAAIDVLRNAKGLDLADARNAEVLRMLVRLSDEAEALAEVEPDVQAALARHPDVAAFHAIRGLWLERSGAPANEARAAYEAAIRLDPDDAGALAGLGRVELARDLGAAIAYLDRAARADPDRAEGPMLEAARALIRAGKRHLGLQRLDRLLDDFPYSREAASLVVELHLGAGQARDQTLERARRAVRFRGGPEALDALARVYESRDEHARALAAQARARALRERRASEAHGSSPASPTG